MFLNVECFLTNQMMVMVQSLILLSVSLGMIRLPKATKTNLKSKLIPRQSLATIVKDLGETTSHDCNLNVKILHAHKILPPNCGL